MNQGELFAVSVRIPCKEYLGEFFSLEIDRPEILTCVQVSKAGGAVDKAVYGIKTYRLPSFGSYKVLKKSW